MLHVTLLSSLLPPKAHKLVRPSQNPAHRKKMAARIQRFNAAMKGRYTVLRLDLRFNADAQLYEMEMMLSGPGRRFTRWLRFSGVSYLRLPPFERSGDELFVAFDLRSCDVSHHHPNGGILYRIDDGELLSFDCSSMSIVDRGPRSCYGPLARPWAVRKPLPPSLWRDWAPEARRRH